MDAPTRDAGFFSEHLESRDPDLYAAIRPDIACSESGRSRASLRSAT